MVERKPEELRVVGSIPTPGTILFTQLLLFACSWGPLYRGIFYKAEFILILRLCSVVNALLALRSFNEAGSKDMARHMMT